MAIFIEIVSVLWQTIVAMLGAFVNIVIELLPEFLQLKQIMGYFTPEGLIALWIGVPTIVIIAVKFIIKKLVKEG